VSNNKQELDAFFLPMIAHAEAFTQWTDKLPKYLIINPDILTRLSRIEGFYQRPEVASMVSAHAPIVRYFKLPMCTVMIHESPEEDFYHFES
jgi:hypothetical protein